MLTRYGCPGADLYVRSNLGRVAPWCETVYTVARTRSRIVGCGEFRRTARGVFLNHIAVEPAARGQGVGSRLLGTSLRQFTAIRDVGPGFALDVFTHNRRAVDWYRRMGLETTGTFAWYEVAAPRRARWRMTPTRSPELRVRDLAQADAVHARLGFSEFTVEKRERRYSVGRLARRWYRLTEPEAAADPAVIEMLRALEPRRGVFLIARPIIASAPWPMILSGWRMEGPLSSVAERLELAAGEGRGESV
jgi:GNAT superfamily N-acetyltransferase